MNHRSIILKEFFAKTVEFFDEVQNIISLDLNLFLTINNTIFFHRCVILTKENEFLKTS
jgi:hypothetical protein